MTLQVQKVTGIIVGQYGEAITLSVLDENGDAADLSAYTVAVLRSISDDAQKTLQLSGTIVAATGNSITVTPDTANYFDRDGDWNSQLQLSDTGILALTTPFIIEVSKQI